MHCLCVLMCVLLRVLMCVLMMTQACGYDCSAELVSGWVVGEWVGVKAMTLWPGRRQTMQGVVCMVGAWTALSQP